MRTKTNTWQMYQKVNLIVYTKSLDYLHTPKIQVLNKKKRMAKSSPPARLKILIERSFDVWKHWEKLFIQKTVMGVSTNLWYSPFRLIGFSIWRVFWSSSSEKYLNFLSKLRQAPRAKIFQTWYTRTWRSWESSTNESKYCMILWVKICEVIKKSQVGKYSVYRVKSVILKKKKK